MLALLAPLGACVPNDAGAGGTGGRAGTGGAGPVNCGSGGSTGGSGMADFATMMFIVQNQCGGSGCHNETQAPALFVGDLYTTLTTFRASKCGNRLLVAPCAPEESAFYLAQRGMCGTLDKMPKGCIDNCTPDNYLEGIREWIAKGAPRQ